MDRRIAKLPPQDRSRFSSWILKFSDVLGGGGGGGGPHLPISAEAFKSAS